jgi:adenylate kinase family enzyme
MVRWRLFRNDCQNRGYVLDGFPKNFHQANEVFVMTPPMPKPTVNEDGEEEPIDEEILKALKPTLTKEIYPESVISLNATK